MKRILSGALAVLMLCGVLVGCGKPSGMHESTYETGVSALEIADKFLDGAYEASETYPALEQLKSSLSGFSSDESDELKAYDERTSNTDISIYIAAISQAVVGTTNPNGGKTIVDVQTARDELAKLLGK